MLESERLAKHIDAMPSDQLDQKAGVPYGHVRDLRIYQQSVVAQQEIEAQHGGKIPDGAYFMDKPYGFTVVDGVRTFKG